MCKKLLKEDSNLLLTEVRAEKIALISNKEDLGYLSNYKPR